MRKFNKIFGVGLSRTGTNSLTEALRVLGLSAVHFPARFVDIEEHTAATDTRVAEIFDQLDVAFPGSLFILTVRDMEGWLKSVERYWQELDQFRPTPGIRELHVRLYGSADFDRESYAAGYARHLARVKRYFADRPRDLLEMSIVTGDGWPQLAAFLDVPVPAVPFPHDRAAGRERPGP